MERFSPMIRQSSWAINEDKFSMNVANKENGVDINFHGDLPYYDKVLLRAINGIELMFWRDPTCKEPLSFTLTIDTYGSLGKVVIRYRTIVLVFTFMVVILTIRAQIKDWCRNESFKPFGVVLSGLLRTTFWKLSLLLVFVSFMQSFMSKNIVILSPEAMANSIRMKSRSWISRAWFDNALLGRNETFFWLLLPIFLHVSAGIVAFVWFSLGTIVRAISFFTRLLTRNTSTQNSSGAKSRAIVIGTFMFIATAVPYQLAFAMTVIALVVISAKKLVVAQSTTEIAYTQAAWDRFHFSMSILVMFFFLLPFTIPSLMVWVRNIAGGWLHSFPSDHRVDYVGPFIVFVEGIANGAAVTRMTWKR
ncbi:GPI inositol deacylase [Mortierella sp. AD011]|nr:GPI inositol deacylase [Mortierella sp. AD011]